MIILTSRETLLIKGIKLEKVYSFKHIHFEKFYEKFNGDDLYKHRSILMAFFALYGDDYSIKKVYQILLSDCVALLLKIGFELKEVKWEHKENILFNFIGELAIFPIAVLDENGEYIQKIEYKK